MPIRGAHGLIGRQVVDSEGVELGYVSTEDEQYLLTADGQWVRTPGGDWQQLDTQQPPAAPLTQLAAPSRLELVRNEAGTVELSATYDGAVFGLASSEVVVLLTFRDGLLTEAGYTSEQEGVEAEVITQFAPAADTTPITAPPAES